MRTVFYSLISIALLFAACSKEDIDIPPEKDSQEQTLHESNLDFINSDWSFEQVEDSIKNQLIGLWLSKEVAYDDSIRDGYVGVFSWVLESTGKMGKRNNFFGDNETIFGNWELDETKTQLLFSYKQYALGGPDYQILTDTITIKELDEQNLCTSHYRDYSRITKMDVKFIRLR